MPVTLNDLTAFTPVSDITVNGLTIDPHTVPVQIFNNTKAVEIPGKINAIAEDLRTFINDSVDSDVIHTNTAITDLVNHVNTVIGDIFAHLNTTTIAELNTEFDKVETEFNTLETNVLSQQSTFQTTITNQQSTFQTNITNQQNTFEQDISDNIATYVAATPGTTYDINQQNDMFKEHISTAPTLDSEGRITDLTQGGIRYHNIVYGADSEITSYSKTTTFGAIVTTYNYTVSYDSDGNIIAVTEV